MSNDTTADDTGSQGTHKSSLVKDSSWSTPRLSDRQLQAFRHTMECGSVSAAARRMLIAQPGVTRLLKQLEYDLGFALFARQRGRLVATPEAWLFYREQMRLWQGLDRLRATAQRIRQREMGGLGVSALPLLGLTFLPEVVAGIAKQHPDQRIRLIHQRSEHVIEDVVTQRAEIGFSLIGGQDERLSSEQFQLANVCLMPLDHPLVELDHITLSDLEDQPLIQYEAEDPSRRSLSRALEDEGIAPRTRLEVSLALQAVRMVERGAGIAVIDMLNAAAADASTTVIRPLRAELNDTFYLLSSRDQPLSRLAQDFIERFRHSLHAMSSS